jgi:ABC-2 type transport system ATP-binding protein
MVAGELVAEGSPSGIKSQQPGHLIELQVSAPQLATDRLKTVMDRWRVSLFGDRVHVITMDPANEAIRRVTNELTAAGVDVLSAREARFSLEDVFISVVEQAREAGKVMRED